MNWPPLRPASWDLKRPHSHLTPIQLLSPTNTYEFLLQNAFGKYLLRTLSEEALDWGLGVQQWSAQQSGGHPCLPCRARASPVPAWLWEEFPPELCWGGSLRMETLRGPLLLPCWGPGSFHFQNGELRGKDWQRVVLAHGNGCFFWALWDAIVLVRTSRLLADDCAPFCSLPDYVRCQDGFSKEQISASPFRLSLSQLCFWD